MAKTQTAELAPRPSKSPLDIMGARFNIEPDKLLQVLKGTVLKPAKNASPPTNEEIAAFTMVANEYGLNPFTKEIHGFVSGGAVVPIVGIDGWARIVNTNETFDGCEFDFLLKDDDTLNGCTCRMHVKGRSHPVEVTEWYDECKRTSIPWQQMPRRMMRHKAFMQAARIAFGLHGIYDEDEAKDVLKRIDSEVVDSKPLGSDAAKKRILADSKTASEPPAPDTPPEPEERASETENGLEKVASEKGDLF